MNEMKWMIAFDSNSMVYWLGTADDDDDDHDVAGEPHKYNLTTLTGSERSSVLGNFKDAVGSRMS